MLGIDIEIKVLGVCQRFALTLLIMNQKVIKEGCLVVVFHLVHRDLFDHVQSDERGGSLQNGKVNAGDLPVVLPDVDAAVFFLIAVDGNDDLIADQTVDAVHLAAAHQRDGFLAGGAGADEIFHAAGDAFPALLAACQHEGREEVIVDGNAVAETVKKRLHNGLQIAAAQHGGSERLLQLVDIPQGLCLIIYDGSHNRGDDLREGDIIGNLKKREGKLVAEIKDRLWDLVDVAVEFKPQTNHAVGLQLRDQLEKLRQVFPNGISGGNQQLAAGNGTDNIGVDHNADRGNDLVGAGSTGKQAGIVQDLHAENRIQRYAVIVVHARSPPTCFPPQRRVWKLGAAVYYFPMFFLTAILLLNNKKCNRVCDVFTP